MVRAVITFLSFIICKNGAVWIHYKLSSPFITDALATTTEKTTPAKITGLWLKTHSERFQFKTMCVPYTTSATPDPQSSFSSLSKEEDHEREQKHPLCHLLKCSHNIKCAYLKYLDCNNLHWSILFVHVCSVQKPSEATEGAEFWWCCFFLMIKEQYSGL